MTVEAVNPLTLPSLKLQERRSLPECAAVYFVLNSDDKILYIGGTANLAQRWLTHHRWTQLVSMGDGIRIAWLECSEPALLLEIETALIEHFHPTLNRTPVLSDKQRRLEAVTAYLEPDLKAVLEEWADSESRSLSSLVVYLLSQAAKERQQDKGAA